MEGVIIMCGTLIMIAVSGVIFSIAKKDKKIME